MNWTAFFPVTGRTRGFNDEATFTAYLSACADQGCTITPLGHYDYMVEAPAR